MSESRVTSLMTHSSIFNLEIGVYRDLNLKTHACVLSKGLHFLLRAHDWHQDYHSQPVVYNRACSVLSKGLHFLLRAHDWHQDYHSQFSFIHLNKLGMDLCYEIIRLTNIFIHQPVVFRRSYSVSRFQPTTGIRTLIVRTCL
ncbi:hypothetical protein DAPPUDRAFT_265508 [Daphnia pulex]|uniref:Uncharacterized protein n=1 Tax=Daphnia pulex TaxID=6669 RepID=E9HTK2_DAPPU|nr:hypothetical protein DAPPUDRAFT_265508 [Daphnia pulex]|eukprot:EFX64931.1 hypothetical protein DAPPUDRAFT_265508 [Daphnia pulex]